MLYEIENEQLLPRDWGDYEYKKDIPVFCMVDAERFWTVAEVFFLPDEIRNCFGGVISNFRSELQVIQGYLVGNITLIDVKNMNDTRMQMGLVMGPNMLLLIRTVDLDQKMKYCMKQVINKYMQAHQCANIDELDATEVNRPYDTTLGSMLYSFLYSFLNYGYESIEQMEMQMVDLEQEMLENRLEDSLNREIFRMKKCIFVWNRFYEQMVDVGQKIAEWNVEFGMKISQKEKSKIELDCNCDQHLCNHFIDKAKRLCEETKGLKEELMHLRETLDATLEYNLNRIMKVFTAVTTICFPLSLIAGWYGMNFSHMPELDWKYGYMYVWVLGISVVGGCIWYFRKKKWF